MALQQAHITLNKGGVIHPRGYEATTVPEAIYYTNQLKEGLRWLEQATDPADDSLIPGVFNEIITVRNTTGGTLAPGNAILVTKTATTCRATAKTSQEPDATHYGHVDAIVCDHSPGTIYQGHIFRAVLKGHVDTSVFTAAAVAVGDALVACSTAGAFQPADFSAAGTADLAYNILAGSMVRAREVKAATGGDAAAGTVKVECEFPLAKYSF